jgi:hypothetical protein
MLNTITHPNIDAAIEATDFLDKPEPTVSFDEIDRVTSVTKKRYDRVTKNEVVTVTHGFSFSNGDELATKAKAPDYLINGILESDSHGMLAGASMAFKTFVAIGMVHSICTGADFMGQKVYKTGTVLYVCGEGQGALSRRIKAKQIVDGGFNGNLKILDGTVRIDNKNDMERLKQAIDEIQPVLVVFDTFASLVSETDENSPSDVGRVLRLIKETCRNASNTSSMIVHHHGKDASKGMRGASNFTNDVDFSFELTRNIDSMMTTLSCKKMKDGENFNDIHIMARVVELGLIKQDGTETTSLVMAKSDHAPAKKSANKLNPNSERALSKLREAITAKGIVTPEVVRVRYPDNQEKMPRYVVTIDQWREFAFAAISVNSDPADKKKHDAAKRKALWDSKKQLETYGFIGVEGDYIWAI